MSDQFYITIPSNAHEDNTASDFRIVLPQRILSKGEAKRPLFDVSFSKTLEKVTLVFLLLKLKNA